MSTHLNIYHVNAQSLPCHIDEFREYFRCKDAHIIVISESWLKPHITSKHVALHGYNLYRCDRIGKAGGGVAIYASSDLRERLLPRLPIDTVVALNF